MNILKMLKIADYFTLGNFIAGVIAIFFAVSGNLTVSAALILLAVLLDFLDGRIARLTKQSNELGREMDSLADLVSFGLWPAVFAYQQGLNTFIDAAVLVFFASCGILRLARFNISRQKHFEGVPITVNGVIFPLLYFCFQFFGTLFSSYVIILYLVMGLLMISSIRIGKL